MTKQRNLTILLIVLGLLLVAFFGMRAFHAFRKFSGHRPPPAGRVETDVNKIQDWMTIPFISRMYLISPKDLFDALEIPPQGNQDKSLKDLNNTYYPQSDGIVMEKVKAAIQSHKPPPPHQPADTSIPPKP